MKKRKHTTRLLLFTMFLSMLAPFKTTEIYYAATSYTNAKEFYESTALDGENYHAEMVNGTIYYATVGRKASSNANLKYTSIGSDITLSAGGQSLTFSVKIGQSLTQIQSANVETSTHMYHLYMISTESIYQLAMAINPNIATYIFNHSQINVLMNTIMTTSQYGITNGSIRENGKGGLYEDGNIYHLADSLDLATMRHIFRGHDFKSYINIKEKMNNPQLQLRYNIQGLEASSSTATIGGTGFSVVNDLLYQNGSPYIQSFKIFQQATLLSPSTILLQKPGYHLVSGREWITNDGRIFSASTVYMPKDIDPTVGNQSHGITLYANWQPNNYTVTYDANGGAGTVFPTSFAYNQANYLRVNSFYRTGYYLVPGSEWNTKPNGTGTSYGSNQLVNNLTSHNENQMVLYANWKPVIVSITTDKQGGSKGTDIFYEKFNTGFSLSTNFSDLIQSINTPSRTGYDFLGYFRGHKSLGNSLVNTNGTLEVGSNYFVRNSTIYADWKAKQYTVTFDKQGGSSGTSYVTSTYDQRMPLADAPIKTGFSFKGYYSQPDKNGTLYYNEFMASDIIYQTDANITLYAYWLDDILPDVYLNIDKNDWTNQAISLSVNAYDYGMGLDHVKIYKIELDGSTSLVAEENDLNGIHSTSLSFVNTIEGITRYKAVATDLNGNISESYNVAYYDTQSPTGDYVETSQDGTTFHFKIHVTDIHVQ